MLIAASVCVDYILAGELTVFQDELFVDVCSLSVVKCLVIINVEISSGTALQQQHGAT